MDLLNEIFTKELVRGLLKINLKRINFVMHINLKNKQKSLLNKKKIVFLFQDYWIPLIEYTTILQYAIEKTTFFIRFHQSSTLSPQI